MGRQDLTRGEVVRALFWRFIYLRTHRYDYRWPRNLKEAIFRRISALARRKCNAARNPDRWWSEALTIYDRTTHGNL